MLFLAEMFSLKMVATFKLKCVIGAILLIVEIIFIDRE